MQHAHDADSQVALVGRLDAAEREGMTQREGINRREMFGLAGAATALAAVSSGGGAAGAVALADPAGDLPGEVALRMTVNGSATSLSVDPRVTLLDALRERMGLTGTKKGCDRGQCGACTVHVDGRRVLSCLTLVASLEGARVTTIEGLGDDERLHPLQQAFIDRDGLQCGFCTSGQIMSAAAVIEEGTAGSDEEIREQMSGNICRCSAYPGIAAAIVQARKEMH